MVNETQEIEIKDLNIHNCDLIQILQQDQYVQRWKQDQLILFLKKKQIQGLILFKNKKPIGYCLFRKLIDEAEILSIEILKKYRKKNYGLILFLKLEKIFLDLKVSKVFLEVSEKNLIARNFYGKLGFICKRTIKNYYKICNSSQNGLLLQKTYF